MQRKTSFIARSRKPVAPFRTYLEKRYRNSSQQIYGGILCSQRREVSRKAKNNTTERPQQGSLSLTNRRTYRLKPNEDLDHLRSIAQDRQQWKGLTTKIREAAEASRSED
ncbi:hypothetical protein ElyMa_003918100 [Elysia marginata]|uniref:Uncharacterized protein n=1 Tax=Elysia marginata TaxID=1093978 RepID=A0AAV4FRU1_9GAST|nr:hypothetical protein ElyMa_003918100 [Elysia marginata]